LGAENKDVKAPKTGLITNRRELNLAIKNGPNRKVGFLSEANYKSVHTVLHEGIEPEYFTDTEHLYDAVRAGTVIAGFISGVPDETEFQVFSSELISPRSFQMSKGPESRDLMEAVDAAVVRTHNLGELQLAARKNPPLRGCGGTYLSLRRSYENSFPCSRQSNRSVEGSAHNEEVEDLELWECVCAARLEAGW